MEPAEIIVYATVWVALLCYPAAAIGYANQRPAIAFWARLIWSLGGLVFLLHVVSAFGVFYGWSHAVALDETARQTQEATGVDSGTGLYLNYLFAGLWAADAMWWWWRPASYQARSLGLFSMQHAFFLFMIVNGAVFFVTGPRRWLGVLLTAAGITAVVKAGRRRLGQSQP